MTVTRAGTLRMCRSRSTRSASSASHALRASGSSTAIAGFFAGGGAGATERRAGAEEGRGGGGFSPPTDAPLSLSAFTVSVCSESNKYDQTNRMAFSKTKLFCRYKSSDTVSEESAARWLRLAAREWDLGSFEEGGVIFEVGVAAVDGDSALVGSCFMSAAPSFEDEFTLARRSRSASSLCWL